MKFRFLLAAFWVCLSMCSCRKVELADAERLANTWKLQQYLVDGVDKTSELRIHDFTEKIEEYDFYGYSYWYIDAQQDSIVDRGSSYTLFANADSISFYTSRKIPLTPGDTMTGDRRCRIMRLTKSTFTYEFQLNGSLHRFQMVGM